MPGMFECPEAAAPVLGRGRCAKGNQYRLKVAVYRFATEVEGEAAIDHELECQTKD